MKTQTLKLSLQRISKSEDTTTIAGREITITQAPHMKAEVERSKSILQNLQRKRAQESTTVYSSEVVKTIEI